jgi:oxaloacetate decarboxylase alpha subunit
VDIAQIKELIQTVQETGIGEVTVEEAGSKITVRSVAATTGEGDGPKAQAQVLAQGADAGALGGTSASSVSAALGERPLHWIAVKSPMVGTFYAAPAPDEPPFVEVGSEVLAGQTLCIIEAMKLMNEIKSEQMGTVREVCMENALPVEYDTVLFYIEPTTDQPMTDTIGNLTPPD